MKKIISKTISGGILEMDTKRINKLIILLSISFSLITWTLISDGNISYALENDSLDLSDFKVETTITNRENIEQIVEEYDLETDAEDIEKIIYIPFDEK